MSDNLTLALIELIEKSQNRGFDWTTLLSTAAPFLFFVLIFGYPSLLSVFNGLKLWWYRRTIETTGQRKLVTMWHQSNVGFLGLGMPYISLADSSAMVRFFREVEPGCTVELLINTPGGMVLAAQQIAMAMRRFTGKVNVYVSQYAMSGGTLLALAADKIYMSPNAVLGPLDPQLSSGLFEQYPCVSIVKAASLNNPNRDDKTLILADVSRKAISQMQTTVFDILKGRMGDTKANELACLLTSGQWTHDYAITYESAKELGLPVSQEIPADIARLITKLPKDHSSVVYRKPKKKPTSGISISL